MLRRCRRRGRTSAPSRPRRPRRAIPVLVARRARSATRVTPQPVFARRASARRGLDALAGADLAVVAASSSAIRATRARSCAARPRPGAQVVVLGAGSVDAYNPKVVRASAGACFAVRIVEGVPAVEMLDALADARRAPARRGRARRRRARGVRPRATRPRSCSGHETRGLDPALPLDGSVTIPMRAGESLNVAMAGTVLLFEAARQRRTA